MRHFGRRDAACGEAVAINPVEELPVADAAEARRRLETGGAVGTRLVLSPWSGS
jgi:hypothetical protein